MMSSCTTKPDWSLHSSRKTPTLLSEGVASATPQGQPVIPMPPGTPRAGASPSPPDHQTKPRKEATKDSYDDPPFIHPLKTNLMSKARATPSANPHPQNTRFNTLDNDDTTDNDNMTLADGLSQSLLGDTLSDDPPPVDAHDKFKGNPPADATDSTTPTSLSDATATVTVDVDNEIDPTIHDEYNAHYRAMSSAIAEALATPPRTTTAAVPAPSPTNNMALFAEIVTRGNQDILAQIRVENEIHHVQLCADIRTDIDDICGMATRNHDLVLGRLNLALTATDHHKEELAQMNTWLNDLATTIAETVTSAVVTDLNKLEKRVGGLGTLMGHYPTKAKTLSQQLLDLQQGFDACLSKLADSIVKTIHTSHAGMTAANDTTGPTLGPAPAPHAAPPTTPSTADTIPDANTNGPVDTPQKTIVAAHRSAGYQPTPVQTDLPLAINASALSPGDFQLPTSHLSNIIDDNNPNVMGTTCSVWKNAHEAAHQYYRNKHEDDPRSPQPPRSQTALVTPVKGGLITSPWNMDCKCHTQQLKASRFDISTLAHAKYHSHRDGYEQIIAPYLQSCGYTTFISDDVVTCFNNIISAHECVYWLWTNSTTNTSRPQVDCILRKSLKLFPTLDSRSTDDVVDFYDWLHEVSPTHLIAIMPFDAVMLRNHFEGLCIPGLGVMCYAAMGKALMELLPHLIPGWLSPQINAALASVRYKTNNGYDYLWHVLELTVTGFDLVTPIQVPVWSDIADIFKFSQAYLLYFRLQGKMNFHYDDCTRSGIFLQAIQYTEIVDMVTTLQSHVNSYRDLDEDHLPPHLRLHGLANSIHQNAKARMRDIVAPRVQRIDGHHDLIQGPPHINKVGHDNRPRARFCDSNDGFGDCPHGGTPWEQQDRPPREHDHNGYDHSCPHSHNQGHLARPDRNRRPFLPNIQSAACKKVGHVAKHCNMLATAICLERYVKHDLSTNVRDSIERNRLKRWKHRLGNPDATPRQVLSAYVEELDIAVARLDDAMEWDCWACNDTDDDNVPSDASA
jgi:hypothetical protein